MSKEPFGMTNEGQAFLYTIENEKYIMQVTDWGATLVSFIDKKTDTDVLIGFDSVQGYIRNEDTYIGASVGRTANRIKDGVFTMNGKEYHVPINNGKNCNHGGLKGFSRHLWQAEETEHSVVMKLHSPNGDEGYPGNMDVTVTFTLDAEGILIKAAANSDADTLFAYTCHAYFNADASDSVLDEALKINASQYAPLDETGVALPDFQNVTGTPFDFQNDKNIAKDIMIDDEQLKRGNGYDHYFDIPGTGMREMAKLKGKKLTVTVSSDLPGIHVYSANYTETEEGKNGRHYKPRCAVALEAEYLPNVWNWGGDLPKPLLKAGEEKTVQIRYAIHQNGGETEA